MQQYFFNSCFIHTCHINYCFYFTFIFIRDYNNSCGKSR